MRDVVRKARLEGNRVGLDFQMALHKGDRCRLEVIICTLGKRMVYSSAEGLFGKIQGAHYIAVKYDISDLKCRLQVECLNSQVRCDLSDAVRSMLYREGPWRSNRRGSTDNCQKDGREELVGELHI